MNKATRVILNLRLVFCLTIITITFTCNSFCYSHPFKFNIFSSIKFNHNTIKNKNKIDSISTVIYYAINNNDRKKLLNSYIQIGEILQEEGYYNLSLSFFQRSIEFADSINDTKSKTLIYNSIATSYRRIEDLNTATSYLKKALSLAYSINFIQGQAFALNGLGNIYLSQKQPEIALVHFEKALKLSTLLKNDLSQAINLANIGSVYVQKKEYKKAIEYYYKSIDYNRKANSSKGLKICYTELGHIYLKINQPNRAIEVLNKRMSQSQFEEPVDSISFLIALSNIYRLKNNYAKGIESAKKALIISKKINVKSYIVDSYSTLAQLYKESNQTQKYLQNYELRLLYMDSLIIDARKKESADIQSIYELEQKNFQIKKLIEANIIKDRKSAKDENTLIIVIILSTSILITIFFISRTIMKKAIQKSNEIEVKYRRSQINPHFIYNSLNSIQKFIWSNNPEVASIYLSNFSSLMRKTLEGMRQDERLLSKEIELLKMYLELEKQRLQNGFDYLIEIDSNIKPDEINVPPLILQPFLENAIWHGIAPLAKDENGTILIRYKRNKSNLIVEVEDNGIGINNSIKIKTSKSAPHHTSAGIEISNERLKFAFKSNNSKQFQNIKIIDISELFPDKHGTIVIINIPYKEIY